MKKHLQLLVFLAASFTLYFGFGFGDKSEKSPVFVNQEMQGSSNPNLVKQYLSRWYEPYEMITPEMRDRMVQEVNQMPGDEAAINNWVLYGPSGQRIYGAGLEHYSGRVLDIEVDGVPSTRVGTASGGLWGFAFIFPIPLSDNLMNTLNIGSFDSKTGDANTILVGTGEAAYNNGSGLFKTTNGGTSYTQVTMSPTPTAFFKLRYAPGSTTIVHAATSTGYYKSTDGGDTWTRYQVGTSIGSRITDLAINASNINILYAPVWGDGFYKSTNAGVNWTKLTAGGIPTTNFGRSSISICDASPNTLYVNVSKNSDDLTLGVYKTTNGGTSWTDVKPVAEFHAFGWYNNACGVSPTDANKIVVGGLTLWRSTNGGTSWTQINNAHADQHSVTWNAAGTSCWVGNDGGMFFSGDGAMTFDYAANYLPITQYVIFDILPNGQYCYGGSQDNGVSGTTNRGGLWYHYIGGDGGGAAIDPVTPGKIAVSNGVYGGSWAFRRLLTTNGGVNWSFIDNGIDPSGQWYHRVRNDKVSPVYLWNNSGAFVYRSTNYGSSWSKTNAAAFPTEVSDMSVSRYSGGSSVVYACLYSVSDKLRVYDGGAWFDRDAGLGANTVRHVEPHMTNVSTGYALMNGLTAGQKIYKTTNRGVNWTNISGDMPNVPMSAMVPHPTDDNKLYVGSEMGCYRSTNGGTNWHRWNNGMANATQVTEMGYIDSISANGKFFVVAATYGRSIYYRDVSGDDPIGISGNQAGTPQHYELSQNYPNPFNPVTKIKFALPTRDAVKLEIFDILGRNVSTILNEEMNAGYHVMEFNASSLSSGIYFYRITTSKLVDTKKMILVK